MGKIIGIDLGTTNSVVAVMEGNDAVVIPNNDGNRTTPSMIAFTPDGKLVGNTAKRQAVTNPEKTIYSIKRFMGRNHSEVASEEKIVSYPLTGSSNEPVKVKIDDKEMTPPELSAMVLQNLKKAAEDYLGTDVTEAVITVPAYFNDSQRQATKDAGRIAGLDVKRIVNEPTAAALAYGTGAGKDEKIAVFDLGGGTFDISILEVSDVDGDKSFEVLATNGDTHLGGDDFDEIIVNWMADTFKKENSIDLRNDPMSLQRLKEAAEKAKCELSSTTSASINLPFITADASGPKHFQTTLSRAQFNELTSDLVARTRIPCETALTDAGLSGSDINEVILVGGSSRILAVQEMVEQIFGKAPHKGVNPDEVVALGAAIQAGVLSGDVNDVLLLDVTPLTLGIETMGAVMTPLIEKNTTIPSKKSEVFSTAADNQPSVDIHVLQGERKMAADNRTLGRFQLTDIPPAPRGTPQIEVTFDLDANGILHVSAKDKGTGKEQKIKIESSSGLSEEEINRMVNDAAANEAEDAKKFEFITAQNSAEQLIFQTEKALKDQAEQIGADDKKKVEEALDKLKKTKETATVKEELDKAVEELNTVFAPIAQKMYEEQAKAQDAANAGGGCSDGSCSTDNCDKNADDDIVDADFEVVDDKDKK